MTEHKQVEYKGLMIDEKILPLVKLLNENGIETLYSCEGDEKNMPYISFMASDEADKLVENLLYLDFICRDIKMKNKKDGVHIASDLLVEYDCELGYFRYCIRCTNLQNTILMIQTIFDKNLV